MSEENVRNGITNDLTRSYHSLWISLPNSMNIDSPRNERELFSSNIHDILTKHGSKLKAIRVTSFTTFLHFETLLKSTPLLESLMLRNTMLHGAVSLNIPELKHLKLYGCTKENEIDSLFPDLNSLISLKFSHVENKEEILQLLKRQTSLKSLTVVTFPDLFGDDSFQTLNQVPFRLKTLMIIGDYTRSLDSNNSKNFEEFLKIHRDTLESFSVKGRLFTPNVAEVLFTSPFKNLSSLEFSTELLSTDKSFYYMMPTMDNVKVLKLHGMFRKADISKLFMSKFTSLESLSIEDMTTTPMSSKFLKTIAIYQRNLKHLSIQNLFKGTPINLSFSNLKSFKVQSIAKNLKIWLNFVLTHLTLEEITVEKLDKRVTIENFYPIIDLPNLTRVTLGVSLEMNHKMIVALIQLQKSMKTSSVQRDRLLQFNIKSGYENPGVSDQKLVKISKVYLGVK